MNDIDELWQFIDKTVMTDNYGDDCNNIKDF